MEIYAEISNKMLREVDVPGHNLVLPYGITMTRKKGSGVCYFNCDKSYRQDMIEFLDDNEISDKPLHESLSDREYEVFIKIAQGKKVSQIAENMILSVHTINTYRARILEKMKMHTNSDLTHYAMQNQLID